MWRKLFTAAAARRGTTTQRSTLLYFSTSSSPSDHDPPLPALYSFLKPTLFSSLLKNPTSSPPPPPPSPPSTSRETLSSDDVAAFESAILSALHSRSTDDAWKAFKALTSRSLFPSRDLTSSLISHLCSLHDLHSLKRAFASALLLLQKSPHSLDPGSVAALFQAFDAADSPGPALALARAMLENRFYPPFSIWGDAVIRVCRRNGGLSGFLKIFEENCRVASEKGIPSMIPDLGAFNSALDGYCRELGSVSGAKRIIESMSNLGVKPDADSFGSMAYLFAWKGLESRIVELKELMSGLRLADMTPIHEHLIHGYVKSDDFKSVLAVMLQALREGKERDCENWRGFSDDTYRKVAKCFLGNGLIKELAGLIIESQEVESAEPAVGFEWSVGFGTTNACISLGWLDKAHSMVDEMNARGASAGLGVYSSILKAYCKERRTAEAAQLVTQIGAVGLQLDSSSYDALIDASMSAHDFQSAFSLFRGMREARLPELKISYLTIMTGLMENNRPELMAGFLDSVFDDPRVEVATHDWNSIIHAFCKVGRLEDARRTYRRMTFLQFEPNEQTYLSLINGYVSSEKYFSVLILWTELKKRRASSYDSSLVDAFLYALVKGGFFDAAMEVIEKAKEQKIFIDKWRYKQAFMETHKKLKVAKMRRTKNIKKMEALIAFKNWAGLNA